MVGKLILRSEVENWPSVERLYLLRLSFSQLQELRQTIGNAEKDDLVERFIAARSRSA